jgi:hypothetical protein
MCLLNVGRHVFIPLTLFYLLGDKCWGWKAEERICDLDWDLSGLSLVINCEKKTYFLQVVKEQHRQEKRGKNAIIRAPVKNVLFASMIIDLFQTSLGIGKFLLISTP